MNLEKPKNYGRGDFSSKNTKKKDLRGIFEIYTEFYSVYLLVCLNNEDFGIFIIARWIDQFQKITPESNPDNNCHFFLVSPWATPTPGPPPDG